MDVTRTVISKGLVEYAKEHLPPEVEEKIVAIREKIFLLGLCQNPDEIDLNINFQIGLTTRAQRVISIGLSSKLVGFSMAESAFFPDEDSRKKSRALDEICLLMQTPIILDLPEETLTAVYADTRYYFLPEEKDGILDEIIGNVKASFDNSSPANLPSLDDKFNSSKADSIASDLDMDLVEERRVKG